jgi:hypothetical protein
MAILIRTAAFAAGVALAMGCGVPAIAGGDDYDAATDTEGKGPAYFGFVRDHRGSPVADARVVLRPKEGDPVTLKSNVLGVYRSHLRKGLSPDDVTVSCEKDGYKLAQVSRRTPAGSKAALIETNCTLQRL